jgi:predicted branched-subunit amino acid permease
MVTDDQIAAVTNPYDSPRPIANGEDQQSLGSADDRKTAPWSVLTVGVLVSWVIGAIVGSFIGMIVWSELYPDRKSADVHYVQAAGLILGVVLYCVFQQRTRRLSPSTAIMAVLVALVLGIGSPLADLLLVICFYTT